MNYFFLYNATTGEIYGSPYLGYTDEWTNVPDGCAVLGPIPESAAGETAKEAFANSRNYLIQNGDFVYRPDPNPPAPSQPTEVQVLQKETTSLRYSDDLISSDLTNLIETLIEKGVI